MLREIAIGLAAAAFAMGGATLSASARHHNGAVDKPLPPLPTDKPLPPIPKPSQTELNTLTNQYGKIPKSELPPRTKSKQNRTEGDRREAYPFPAPATAGSAPSQTVNPATLPLATAEPRWAYGETGSTSGGLVRLVQLIQTEPLVRSFENVNH